MSKHFNSVKTNFANATSYEFVAFIFAPILAVAAITKQVSFLVSLDGGLVDQPGQISPRHCGMERNIQDHSFPSRYWPGDFGLNTNIYQQSLALLAAQFQPESQVFSVNRTQWRWPASRYTLSDHRNSRRFA